MAILFQTQGTDGVKRFLGQAAARARDPRPAFKDAGEEMLVRTQRRMRAGVDVHGRHFKPSKRAAMDNGQTLWSRGGLGASAQYSVTREAFDLFSTDKRARVHYEGLTIVPRNGKFLTIPMRGRGGLFNNAGQSGVANDNRTGTRARHFKNTFFLRRGNSLFLMQRVAKDISATTDGGGIKRYSVKRTTKTALPTALRILFKLVTHVDMPKREWLGFGGNDLEMVENKLAAHVTGEKR